MKSVNCMDFFICSVLVIVSVGFSKAELEQVKIRRGGGTSGLFAFPRVGRSDPSFNSINMHNSDAIVDNALDVLYPASSFEEFEGIFEYPKSDSKRAGMIVHPRVGRLDADSRKWARFYALQQALDKRAGPSATTGVWFGPRLGKRSVNNKQFGKSSKQQNEY